MCVCTLTTETLGLLPQSPIRPRREPSPLSILTASHSPTCLHVSTEPSDTGCFSLPHQALQGCALVSFCLFPCHGRTEEIHKKQKQFENWKDMWDVYLNADYRVRSSPKHEASSLENHHPCSFGVVHTGLEPKTLNQIGCAVRLSCVPELFLSISSTQLYSCCSVFNIF